MFKELWVCIALEYWLQRAITTSSAYFMQQGIITRETFFSPVVDPQKSMLMHDIRTCSGCCDINNF